MSKKSAFRRIIANRRVQIAGGVVFVFFGLYFLFDSVAMPLYTRQGSERAVPKLAGLTLEQAVVLAKQSGFALVEEPAKMGGNVPEGTILEQHPFAGSLAKPGRKIRVIPAMKASGNVTPDLSGLELRDAQLRCKNVGLLSGESDIRYRFSDKVAKGWVIAQDPLPGKKVEPAGVVKLVVSLGATPSHFYVPYLMEKPLHEARSMLRDSGLKMGKIVKKETDQYPSGTVIAQSIRSGEEVGQDTPVDVVVAVTKGGATPQ